MVIRNTPPTAPAVDVTPDRPRTDDDLRVSVSGSEDADGDPISYSYRWYRGGGHEAAFDDLTTVPASVTSPGDTWRCVVTPTDGADAGAPGADEVSVRGVRIVAGPAGSPDPAASGGAVRMSVEIAGCPDADVRYEWSARDGAGDPAGSFDDATSARPTWTAPEVTRAQRYEIAVTVRCDDDTVVASASFQHRVLPAVRTRVRRGWSMPAVGLPAAAGATFADLLGPGLESVVVWDARRQRYQHLTPSAVFEHAGRGLWARANAAAEAAIPTETPGEIAVAVAPGWNLLANPFPHALDLEADAVAQDAGRLMLPAFHWNGSTYELLRIVPPGCSFWIVATYEGTVTLRSTEMPSALASQPASLARPSAEAGSGTFIQIATETEGCVDADTWIGTTGDGTAIHTPKPPARPGGAASYLDAGGGIGHAHSLLPAGAEQTWRLHVVSPPGSEVTLRIVDTSHLDGQAAVWLRDLATGRRVDLRHAPGYTFAAREGARQFELSLGRREGLVQVMAMSARPAGDGARISFTLSAPAAVTVDIMNVAGRTVRQLVTDRECAGGMQALTWNGRSDAGTRAPRGTYLVRVRAGAATGDTAHGLAPVVVR